MSIDKLNLIYIAHPFGGKQENVDKVQAVILRLIKQYPECTFYSPLHATGFFYHEMDYLTGMNHCFEILSHCDALWLCEGWEESRGCNMEYAYALGKGIYVRGVNV